MLPANGFSIRYDPPGTTSTKYLDLEQDGNNIKGHFKGTDQSGLSLKAQSTGDIWWCAPKTVARWYFAKGLMDQK